MIDTRIGHYVLSQKLGAGGFGEVWCARHVRQPELQVAIKLVGPTLARDSQFVEALTQECVRLDGLDHPNIVRFRDLLVEEPHVAMVLELLHGEDLHQRLTRGPLTVEAATPIIEATLEALAYAHSKGVMHRDVKPSNVSCCEDGRVKLLDFGIARAADNTGASKSGHMLGTLNYMASERFTGEGARPASDVYAVGLVFWELLTGKPACPEGEPGRKMGWHLAQGLDATKVRVALPTAPGWVGDVIGAMTSWQAADRPVDGAAALALLRRERERGAAGPDRQGKRPLPEEVEAPEVKRARVEAARKAREDAERAAADVAAADAAATSAAAEDERAAEAEAAREEGAGAAQPTTDRAAQDERSRGERANKTAAEAEHGTQAPAGGAPTRRGGGVWVGGMVALGAAILLTLLWGSGRVGLQALAGGGVAAAGLVAIATGWWTGKLSSKRAALALAGLCLASAGAGAGVYVQFETTPRWVAGLGRAVAVSGGYQNTCAIDTEGRLGCWQHPSGRPPLWDTTRYKQVAAGFYYVCAITVADELRCFDDTYAGGKSPPEGRFSSVSAGMYNACAIEVSGDVRCWGKNGPQTHPGQYTQVGVGDGHVCALKPAGDVDCWGLDDLGQSTPPVGKRFVSIDAGGKLSCGLDAAGAIRCWGDGQYRQDRPPVGAFIALDVDIDGTQPCAVRADEGVYCWGWSSSETEPWLSVAGRFTALSASGWDLCGLGAGGLVCRGD